jgi:hypothetical protein
LGAFFFNAFFLGVAIATFPGSGCENSTGTGSTLRAQAKGPPSREGDGL